MKKPLLKIIAIVSAASVAFCSVSFAHSGRTDSSGGHRDNKNKSGLGYYHYHCGGNPPHLHANGVCPYRSRSYSSRAYSSSSAQSAQSVSKNVVPRILGTSMRTFIKGKEISTYHYNGTAAAAVIVAEELEAYGFDVNWVEAWNTLYIARNDAKDAYGMPVALTYDGQYISDVLGSNATIRLVYGDGSSYVPVSYSLGNKMIIPVEELKCLGKFRYDAIKNAIYID